MCSKSKHAVLPKNIDTHLKDKDIHNIAQKNHWQIIQKVHRIKGLIQKRFKLN